MPIPPTVAGILRQVRSGVPKAPGKGTLRCYYKPFRKQPRVWNAKSAARAVCAAVKSGTPPAELRAAFAECVPCTEGRRRQQSAVAAQQALQASQTTLAVADGALLVMELLARYVGRVARFVPQSRAAGLGLSLIEGRLGAIRAEIVVTRAANDAALRVLRAAA